ncbi:MAG: hypothetical protein ACI857_000376 [Arenicella sp.]|jgi:hypothetical protein
MKLLILMVIGNVAPFKGIYYTAQDSIELNNQTIQILSDEKESDYKAIIYKEDGTFHLDIESRKKQKLTLKFQNYSSLHGPSIYSKSEMGNTINFTLEKESYNYQLSANNLTKGIYECSLNPGFEREFFHVYHF